jgi:aryl-alcohol dehydrogenase-like predicted oxidoreductase
VLRTFGRAADASAVIEASLGEGIRYIESARAYSGSEAYLGGVLGSRRSALFLATKAHDRSAAGAQAMLERSLVSLRTAQLDLWQFHDLRTVADLDEMETEAGAYGTFERAKANGDVAAIGVTGHHDPRILLEAIERFRFDSVLLPINPAEGALPDAFERTVIPAARARGMAVIGMKVLARGLLVDPRGAGVAASEAIRYALSADCDVIVVGCDDVAQVRENTAAARSFTPMPSEERCMLERRVAERAQSLAYYRGTFN